MCVDTRIDFPRVTDSLVPWPQSNDFGHISYRKFSSVRGWRAKVPVMMRFDHDVLARVDAAAKRRGISRSAWIQFTVSRALDQGEG